LTHDSISQKNIDEAVDQRRKQLSVYDYDHHSEHLLN